jgi:hypothetical protein
MSETTWKPCAETIPRCSWFYPGNVPSPALSDTQQFTRAAAKIAERCWRSETLNDLQSDDGIARGLRPMTLVTIGTVEAIKVVIRWTRVNEANRTLATASKTERVTKHVMSDRDRRGCKGLPFSATKRAYV